MNHLDDKHLVFHSLGMWINHLETGDVVMSSVDAVNCGQPGKVKALSDDQKRLVLRLRDLQKTALSG